MFTCYMFLFFLSNLCVHLFRQVSFYTSLNIFWHPSMYPEVGLAGKIIAFHEAFFRELTEAEKAFDEATINLEDFFWGVLTLNC